MKRKGIVLIILGILGGVSVYMFDIIMGKPVNDITGPKSIFGFVACAIIIIAGVRALCKKGPS